ncbi:hypothetical protein DSO57_1035233 [Entomophthora muscae]|uniref:Uncharacterized protein n=1 Tax=Entomophthora muscae TaxID=34485 RepID=A0ACC2SNP4_9FUNG|nr:hypothetical protein DSO57_1035233 [Entomophthora muscae]
MLGGTLGLFIAGVSALRLVNSRAHDPNTQEKVFTKSRSTISKKYPEICDSVYQISGIIESFLGRQFFYWHFESRRAPSEDPLVVYVNGALGSSSILGLNSGVFPCQVNKHGNGTQVNPFALNSHANLLFIDPIGVGFAPQKGKEGRLLPTDIAYVLQQFMRSYPKMQLKKVHLMGESHGSAILLEAAKVIRAMQLSHTKDISLASVIVGSALVDATVHYALLPDLAKKLGVDLGSPSPCIDYIVNCRLSEADCVSASKVCGMLLIDPYHDAGHSIYQLDRPEMSTIPYLNTSNIIQRTEMFLNMNCIRKELGIPSEYIFHYNKQIDSDIEIAAGEAMKDYRKVISELSHNGVRVLLYAGDLDYITNSLGLSSILNEPRTSSLTSPITGDTIGSLLVTKESTAVKFANTTHHVQIDKPGFLNEVIIRWIYNQLG